MDDPPIHLYDITDAARRVLIQPAIRFQDSKPQEVNMSEQEKSEFERELQELLKKYDVRLYQDRSDWKWYFMDGWDGKIYFPITNLPQEDNRDG